MKKLIVYTDGGARGNPGPAGIGVVITTPELEKKHKVQDKHYKYIGERTNNQAEYEAVVLGLEQAKQLKAKELEFYLDSELVVSQLNMKFKIKDEALGKLFIKIWNLRQIFQKVTFNHIPREQNKLADKLVNKAIDERQE